MSDESCEKCRFWRLLPELMQPPKRESPGYREGSCRKRPPRSSHSWSLTYSADWCGGFEPLAEWEARRAAGL